MCETRVQCTVCRARLAAVILAGAVTVAVVAAVLVLLHHIVLAVLGGTGIALALTGSQKWLMRHTVLRVPPGVLPSPQHAGEPRIEGAAEPQPEPVQWRRRER